MSLPPLMSYLAVRPSTCLWCGEPIGAGDPTSVARATAAHSLPRACLDCGWAAINNELDKRRRTRGC